MTAGDDVARLADLAHRAYVYGFPLVFNLQQVQRYVTTGVGANPAAPFNTFSHARTLATPADRFVTINNDTVYSFAQLDLSAGPLVLDVPDAAGRYFVLQFISAWTENFAYVGKRATGTKAARFLLVPPGWTGQSPPGMRVIEFPTLVGTINGRWAVTGPDDLRAVHQLQDAMTLRPLASAQPGRGVPSVPPAAGDAMAFWEAYRVWSQAFPPSARDADVQAGFAGLGLAGTAPLEDSGDEVKTALQSGYRSGGEFIAGSLRGGHVPAVNGWLPALHAFDYNIDHFQVGTIDAPEWRIEDSTERFVMRAGAALGGLWGNHGYEAAYVAVYVDDRGEQLTGSRTYQLTLDPPPPNDAFWSLTMYDVPDYFLVANEIDRYSIGDRTPGTVTEPGGGLTITMSRSRPEDPAAAANWLPTPARDFRPMLRVYMPGTDVLDGTYEPPPIRRID